MTFPKRTNIPSESTIEVLNNHFVLQLLNQLSAWILCPTRNEERNFGYDASLENSKLAIIQYKRIDRINKNGTLSVAINVEQHRVLLKQFSRLSHPYVFYCFSKYRNYRMLGDDFIKYGAPYFFNNSVFFDAWDVPLGSSSIRFSPTNELAAHVGKRTYSKALSHHTGPQFIRLFKDCNLGEQGASVAQASTLVSDVNFNVRVRIHVLHWPK